MIEKALRDAGGAEYLREQARESPAAFMALVGKLIPKDLTVSGGASPVILQIVTGVPDAGSGR